MAWLLLAICALLASGASRGETVDMLFRNWNTRDGLPHNRVRDVIRSRDGFIWLATDGGAVRFDGANFETIGLAEGLPSPVVLALKETRDGTLWFGTLGGGLCSYGNGRIERVFTIADGLPSNWISGLDSDPEGRLVVSTLTGMARLENGKFVSAEGDPPVVNVLQDASGTRFGLLAGRYVRYWDNGKWLMVPELGADENAAMTLAPDGRLWIVTGGRLWSHGKNGWNSRVIPEMPPARISLAVDREGTVWLAFHRAGLIGFRDGKFVTPTPGPDYVPDMVEVVIATSDGQMWLTSSQGLYRMTESNIRTVTIDDPSAPRVANNFGGLLEIAPGAFLIATQGGGFYRWENGIASRLNDDPGLGAGIYGNIVFRGRGGESWLGSSKGLYEMSADGAVRRIELPDAGPVPVWALAETAEGLWIGSGHGQLYLFKDGKVETVSYNRGSEREPIRTIVADADGGIWIGTRGNGIFRRIGGRWQRLGHESGLLSEVIRTLYFDPDGRLWVGTDGGGLALNSPRGFVSATIRNGLPSDSVSQIVMDDAGRLWLGTHRGLAVLDRKAINELTAGNPGNLHPLLINRADGLPSEELTIVPPVKTADGNYAFATVKGFVLLNPADFQQGEYRPKVFIERILANGDRLPATKEKISLPPGTERLEFDFTGLFFADPERLRFRNRLKGVENDWAYVGNRRSAEYRNLRPGSYRFEVEASTGNGLWSERPAMVKLTIAPHFWQTMWFGAAVVAGAVGSVVWIVRRLERSRSRGRIELLKQRRAVDGERARIARDLHDDVGAGLTQMALKCQLAERNITRQPEMAGKSMREIFKSARSMTRALDEIVWTVNPAHDTLENFISFLGSHTQDFTESAGLSCRFDLPDSVPDRIMPATVRHHLYLSAKETLHNVVKHAEASEVYLKVRADDGLLVIDIGDNGIGLEEKAAAPGADGLENLRVRLEKLGGTCRRYSAAGRGTNVELEVPMNWKNEVKSRRAGSVKHRLQ